MLKYLVGAELVMGQKLHVTNKMLGEVHQVDIQSANCVQIWLIEGPSTEAEYYVAVLLRFLDGVLQKAQ